MSEKLKPGTVTDDISQLGRRDAFHVPCVLVASVHSLRPSDGVKVLPSGKQCVYVFLASDHNGIVDPFYPKPLVEPGHPVWVYLDPKVVGDLTHHFQIQGVVEPVSAKEEELAEELAQLRDGDETR